MFEIVVPLERLATRDSSSNTWRPASGRHAIITGRFVGDPNATTDVLDL